MTARWDRAYPAHDLDPDYAADAAARASEKLEALLSNTAGARPAGRFVGPVIVALLFALAPGVLLFYGAWVWYADPVEPAPGLALFLAICGAPLVLLGVKVILDAKADTPKRTLNLFYRALGRGNARRARKLVVPNDLDAFARYQPEIHGLGAPSDTPFRFAVAAEFKDYWNELLRHHSSPYCIARVSRVRVTEVAPGVAVVDYRLRLVMNTSLWILLIVVALIIALIVDLATRKVVEVKLRKVLVRVDDEWHLLNGAWQGLEEEETAWIDPGL